MQTSLSALTLEVYYRYLPIFKTQAMPSEETDKELPKRNTQEEWAGPNRPEKQTPIPSGPRRRVPTPHRRPSRQRSRSEGASREAPR